MNNLISNKILLLIFDKDIYLFFLYYIIMFNLFSSAPIEANDRLFPYPKHSIFNDNTVLDGWD